MDGLCRLCGNEKENLLNIFSNYVETEQLITNIQKILSIEIHKDDFLPVTICEICTNELERITSFIDRSHEAQKHLKQLHEVILLTKDEHSHRIGSASGYLPLHGTKLVNDLSIVDENDKYNDNETFEPESMESEFSDFETNSICDSIDSVNKACTNSCIDSSNNVTDLDQRQRLAEIVGGTKRKVSRSIEIDEIDNFSLISNDSNPEESQNICDRLTRESLQKSILKSTKDGELNITPSKGEISIVLHRFNPLNKDGIIDTTVHLSKNEDQELRTYAENSTTNQQISSNSTSEKLSQDFTNDTNNQKSTKNQSKLRCEKCKKNFDSFVKYEDHISELHPEDSTPYSCKVCGNTFRRRINLNIHLRNIHREKKLKCSLCDYVCAVKGRLTNHMKVTHEKNVTCSQCHYRTGTKSRLAQHMLNKHTRRDKTLICDICGKTFDHQPSLLTHRKNIHFPEPRQCSGCGITYASIPAYFGHKKRCTSSSTARPRPRFECDTCGTSFTVKPALIEHMNTHLNIRPYMCDICGKSFFLRVRLMTHKAVHSSPQFKCNICGRSFNRKYNMQNHQKRQHSCQ